jgi:hypothetical protein
MDTHSCVCMYSCLKVCMYSCLKLRTSLHGHCKKHGTTCGIAEECFRVLFFEIRPLIVLPVPLPTVWNIAAVQVCPLA